MVGLTCWPAASPRLSCPAHATLEITRPPSEAAYVGQLIVDGTWPAPWLSYLTPKPRCKCTCGGLLGSQMHSQRSREPRGCGLASRHVLQLCPHPSDLEGHPGNGRRQLRRRRTSPSGDCDQPHLWYRRVLYFSRAVSLVNFQVAVVLDESGSLRWPLCRAA
jgi:hypothetical protein